MTLYAPVFPQGTRIVVRQGRFPIDETLLGRRGLVVEVSPYEPGRYGVTLDGEEAMREFAEDELERAS